MTIQEKLKFPWAAIDARSVSGPRRVRGFSPPLFCKKKINETKNNLTKITEPKPAPPPPLSKTCCAVPVFMERVSLSAKDLKHRRDSY